MNFVIPMAGRGQRFVDAGYDKPKMLIEAHGKTLLEWSVDSLPLDLSSKLVFILLEEHEREHQLIDFIRSKYQQYNLDFVSLDDVTRGQAETVVMAKDRLDINQDLVIFNIDTYFKSSSLAVSLRNDHVDGVLGTFHDPSDSSRFSYAKTDANGIITQVEEKIHISDNALTGMYHFKRCEDFIDLATSIIDRGETTKGEYYIAPMYNHLIEQGHKFRLDVCENHAILGTPDEFNEFLKLDRKDIES